MEWSVPPQLQSALGLLGLVAIAWGLSEDRRRPPVLLIAAGLGLQIALAALLTGTDAARAVLVSMNGIVTALQDATRAGTSFVFGFSGGAAPPFEVTNPAAMTSLAFHILPLVIVMSALSALLWYWRLLQWVVAGFAFALQKTMRIGGALGLGAAANVFLGMIEAPLLIRPYLAKLSRGELFVLFTCGLSTVSGTVLVLYASVLEPVIPGALGHIFVASIISLPASVLVAKLMIPDDAATAASERIDLPYRSSMDAIAQGTEDGLNLYLRIIAMLIVVLALVALGNIILGTVGEVAGAPVTFERLAGWAFAPLVWLFGIPWGEALTAGALMGKKTILNEFIAYLDMAGLPEGALSPRSSLIMLYAMCGFANLGSAGMMIAAVSAMVPARREEVVSLSLRAIISGTLATGMTGAVIGLLNA
ncbi:MAG: nucleoside:proton symporter [Alphaproteobacteria bacterium]|nr:nucleoside:proton symporter [Alphaproteobacteria bacterium]